MARAELEHEQQRINAYEMPLCLKHDGKNFRKVVTEASNWEIYTYDMKHFYSIAKPNSGCRSSYFGDRRHVERMIREGHIKRGGLTRLGRRLIKV